MTALFNIFIRPIYIIIQSVYVLIWRLSHQSWAAVIGVSLAVCFLTAPIYKRADMVQDAERKKQKEMEPHIAHIKKYFKGDERFMMISTYYRQVGYRPIYVLKQSVSLLIQIPFFMAAYAYLSDFNLLNGQSFWIIKDLSAPDSLLHIGNFGINVLPILMTIISLISGVLYTRGFSIRDKVQVFALPILFLILLYNSPSGLVLYWTMNNVFSFLRIIFTKVITVPPKAVVIGISVLGPVAAAFAYLRGMADNGRKFLFLILIALAAQIPLILYIYRKKRGVRQDGEESDDEPESFGQLQKVWYSGIILLFILMGILIPASVIASSPEEFLDLRTGNGPASYLLYTAEVYFGLFIVWGNVIRALASGKAKKFLSYAVYALCICAVIDYFAFGSFYGVLNSDLQFTDGISLSMQVKLINIAVLAAVLIAAFIVLKKKEKIAVIALGILCISFTALSVRNIYGIGKVIGSTAYDSRNAGGDDQGRFDGIIPLSTRGKNVVVIMLDRAISAYIPYIFSEKPGLKDSFTGFSYYPDTISHGCFTNFGVPGLYGGYDYTPDKMNERKNEKLEDKHDEALKVMPAVFSEEGFNVTVCDPPYAGYQWIPDLSIYDGMKNVSAYRLEGEFTDLQGLDGDIAKDYFVAYSIFKTVPSMIQETVYDEGYYYTDPAKEGRIGEIGNSFMVMDNLDYFTKIQNDDSSNLLLMCSNITHDPQMLQLPDYTLSKNIDNSGLETGVRTDDEGNTLELSTNIRMIHYHANMLACIELAKWFDTLKEAGVYDNTRIILVSDHGRNLKLFEDSFTGGFDLSSVNALLMVKDFDAKGDMVTEDDFMTIADVPTLALGGIADAPVNPFTKNPVDNSEKTAHDQYVTLSRNFDVLENNGNVFDTGNAPWYSVHDDIFDGNNWKKIGPVLP